MARLKVKSYRTMIEVGTGVWVCGSRAARVAASQLLTVILRWGFDELAADRCDARYGAAAGRGKLRPLHFRACARGRAPISFPLIDCLRQFLCGLLPSCESLRSNDNA